MTSTSCSMQILHNRLSRTVSFSLWSLSKSVQKEWILLDPQEKWGLKKRQKNGVGGGRGRGGGQVGKMIGLIDEKGLKPSPARSAKLHGTSTAKQQQRKSFSLTYTQTWVVLFPSPPLPQTQYKTHTRIHTNIHTVHPPSDCGCSLVSICTANLVVTASGATRRSILSRNRSRMWFGFVPEISSLISLECLCMFCFVHFVCFCANKDVFVVCLV